MHYVLARVWTFGQGGGLFPRVTVRSTTYEDAVLRAEKTLDKRYERANKETPIGWDLVLIGVRLPD